MRSDEVGFMNAAGSEPRWAPFHGVERAIVRTLVSEVLADRALTLSPTDMFAAVCEVMVGHMGLTRASFFKRIAGHSRTLAWSAPGVAAPARTAAPEHAWTSSGAAPFDGSPLPPLHEDDATASATVSDEALGLTALLYVESCRALDEGDRALLEDVLWHLVCLPRAEDLPRRESIDG